jgi:hypothetical protein
MANTNHGAVASELPGQAGTLNGVKELANTGRIWR